MCVAGKNLRDVKHRCVIYGDVMSLLSRKPHVITIFAIYVAVLLCRPLEEDNRKWNINCLVVVSIHNFSLLRRNFQNNMQNGMNSLIIQKRVHILIFLVSTTALIRQTQTRKKRVIPILLLPSPENRLQPHLTECKYSMTGGPKSKIYLQSITFLRRKTEPFTE